jgi:hypothetical protein
MPQSSRKPGGFPLWILAVIIPGALVLLCCGGGVAVVSLLSFSPQRAPQDLGPREKIVNGEPRIILTGWDRDDYSLDDYSLLETKPDTVVLLMANANVKDDTLAHLKGMSRLRELDLSDTGVTDAGLTVLADLPRLEELRLARTKISDDGFQKHLAAKESLLKLDLTGTTVKGKTKRDWKKARAGREYLD